MSQSLKLASVNPSVSTPLVGGGSQLNKRPECTCELGEGLGHPHRMFRFSIYNEIDKACLHPHPRKVLFLNIRLFENLFMIYTYAIQRVEVESNPNPRLQKIRDYFGASKLEMTFSQGTL